MAANINQRDGQAAVMVVGSPAWHRLGKVLDKPATAAEAISAARLDWNVLKMPLFVGSEENQPLFGEPQKPQRVADYFAVLREDDWNAGKTKVLGVVGKNYTPLQNHEAFAFFDPIVGQKAAVYHTAGALGEGERVWILAKLPDDIRIIGDDIAHKYLLLSNSHDGNSSVQIKFTPIRVVCQNTLTLALREGPSLRIPHRRDVRERLRLAADLLNAIKVRFNEVEQVFGKMARVQLNEARLNSFLRSVFPDPRRGNDEERYERALAQAQRDRAAAEYRADMGRGMDLKGVRGTLWAAYNGVTEYIDYDRFGNSDPSKQLNAIWFGDGYSAKARAYNVAEQQLKATAV